MILITTHAAQRWKRRVKPHLDLKEASRELQRLIKESPIKTGDELIKSGNKMGVRPDQKYVVISDGILAPIEVDKYGDPFITTLLTNAGMSTIKRRQRNQQRQVKRYARRASSSRRSAIPYRRDKFD